ncbi:protein-tyrosine sulfotransferase isoform X1 [Daucus carota subsp. sativus]|uniref:protein-tyrosine sulfotransferase isoform X1 n=2 Tax=Daucus carota subsp. sativus TaxID=79200 RepID=UPI0007EFA342|nr:PREDICTED: protein-tyrosine sulfotransferase isoform X1 [Daucus carota subsp. sativus]
MDHPLKLALLVLIGVACSINKACSTQNDFEHCQTTVKQWAYTSRDLDVKQDKQMLRDLLFFLHIPRTGGRTYFQCFLKKLYSSSLECPRSYDKLRFNPRKADCKLLSTHNDYSIMSKLPKDKTSAMTILRNPLDRIFSTYEFSVEVAARFLVHPNLTSVTRMSSRIRAKKVGVSTLDIWPWKYLVPWMREDLFARREARKLKGSAYTLSNQSYDMKDVVMPLLEYIRNPVALDIIHNGATFQVAGLTNSSNLEGSHKVRHCVVKYQSLGEHVLEVAKKRLDNMLFVGLTEKHKESATLFSHVVGAQAVSQLMALNSTAEQTTDSDSDSESDTSLHQNSSSYQMVKQITPAKIVEATKGNMTVENLMEAYETCVSSLRKTQAQRRNMSLNRISPANFTKEERLHVPELVLQEITSLNNLDVQLYKYAQDIFAKQHRHMVLKLASSETYKLQDTKETKFTSPLGAVYWKFAFISTITLLVFLLLIVIARRKKSKIKI